MDLVSLLFLPSSCPFTKPDQVSLLSIEQVHDLTRFLAWVLSRYMNWPCLSPEHWAGTGPDQVSLLSIEQVHDLTRSLSWAVSRYMTWPGLSPEHWAGTGPDLVSLLSVEQVQDLTRSLSWALSRYRTWPGTSWAVSRYRTWPDLSPDQWAGTWPDQVSLLSGEQVQDLIRSFSWAVSRYRTWPGLSTEQWAGTGPDQVPPERLAGTGLDQIALHSSEQVQELNRYLYWAVSRYRTRPVLSTEQWAGTGPDQVSLLSSEQVQDLTRSLYWAVSRYRSWSGLSPERWAGTGPNMVSLLSSEQVQDLTRSLLNGEQVQDLTRSLLRGKQVQELIRCLSWTVSRYRTWPGLSTEQWAGTRHDQVPLERWAGTGPDQVSTEQWSSRYRTWLGPSWAVSRYRTWPGLSWAVSRYRTWPGLSIEHWAGTGPDQIPPERWTGTGPDQVSLPSSEQVQDLTRSPLSGEQVQDLTRSLSWAVSRYRTWPGLSPEQWAGTWPDQVSLLRGEQVQDLTRSVSWAVSRYRTWPGHSWAVSRYMTSPGRSPWPTSAVQYWQRCFVRHHWSRKRRLSAGLHQWPDGIDGFPDPIGRRPNAVSKVEQRRRRCPTFETALTGVSLPADLKYTVARPSVTQTPRWPARRQLAPVDYSIPGCLAETTSVQLTTFLSSATLFHWPLTPGVPGFFPSLIADRPLSASALWGNPLIRTACLSWQALTRRICALAPQKTRSIHPMLDQCWSSIGSMCCICGRDIYI